MLTNIANNSQALFSNDNNIHKASDATVPDSIHQDEAVVVVLVDVLSNGSLSVHKALSSSHPEGGTPIFECPIKSNSIRLIFRDASNVFSDRLSSTVTSGLVDGIQPSMKCAQCWHSESTTDKRSVSSTLSRNSCKESQPSRQAGVQHDLQTPTGDVSSLHSVSQINISGHDKSDTPTSEPLEKRVLVDTTIASQHEKISGHKSSDETWKRYRGGSSVDPMSVLQLLRQDSPSTELPVGVNLMFDTKNDLGETDNTIWSRRARNEIHTLTLNGETATFFTVPNLLRASRQMHYNSLEVEITFLSTFQPQAQRNATQTTSPLRNQLWATLHSQMSAILLFDGDIEMGTRLLLFDVFGATVTCWLDFLDLVRRKSAWRPASFRDLESLDQLRPILGDREHIADFVRATRDLLQAEEAIIKGIELNKGLTGDRRSQFEYLLLYRRTQHEVIQSTVKDIEDYVAAVVDRAETVTNERQAASLKRLTLVASIFLPLTMACSLLSMSNRVNEIGALWWDWLGIVVIIGFLVIAGYRVTAAWHDFWSRPIIQWHTLHWQRKWDNAKLQVLEEEKEKNERKGFPSRPSQRSTTQTPLIPRFSRWMFRVSIYLFVMGAVASFLIGMFVKVSTGAEALGYSAAGSALIVIGSIVIWTILKLSFQWLFIARPPSDPQPDAGGNPHSRYSITPGRIETTLMLIAEGTGYAAACLFAMLSWLLSIFFGKLVFKVTVRLISNHMKESSLDHTSATPHSTRKSLFSKRKMHDVEADR